MLVNFHRNKLRYEKGQLAPFFILTLVVLIIMAMVTVNLSKVASIKTEASNAADAGSLAAGSIMAKTFNVVANANSELEFYYTTFMVTTMLTYTVIFIYLAKAMKTVCKVSLTAVGFMSKVIKGTAGLLLAVTGYWIATQYFYCDIREMGEKGRDSAIGVGHQFAFINSGIGQKLDKEQRDTFSDFLQGVEGAQQKHTYSWQDGQARQHSVKSQVRIDEVKDYRLHTTLMPYPAEMALLGSALFVEFAAKLTAVLAANCQKCCNPTPPGAACCACQEGWCAISETHMAESIDMLRLAAAGLIIRASHSSSSCTDALPWIITWIDDIKHNRLVKVDTWQSHAGADLGLWQTRYPQTHSLSWVDFRGNGSIHPPELKHDASIIKTDQSGAED